MMGGGNTEAEEEIFLRLMVTNVMEIAFCRLIKPVDPPRTKKSPPDDTDKAGDAPCLI